MTAELTPLTRLQAENEALQQRITALTLQLEHHAAALPELATSSTLLVKAACNSLPYAVYWKDRDLIYRGCNWRFATDLGFADPQFVVGKTDADLPWQPGEAERFIAIDKEILASGRSIPGDEHVIYPDGSEEWFEMFKAPLRDHSGALIGVLGTYINVTQRKRAEKMVHIQAAILAEVSTPLLPIADGVVVMPLIGAIDSRRAQNIIEVLLTGIGQYQAHIAILDITGVKVVDTQVASAFILAAQAVSLLGAKVVLTGISPEIAQSMVQLGIDLRGVITHSSLQTGIAYALSARR